MGFKWEPTDVSIIIAKFKNAFVWIFCKKCTIYLVHFGGRISGRLQAMHPDISRFFVATSPSLIYHVREGNVYILGVDANGKAESVSCHLIYALECAYAKLNMKLCGLSPWWVQGNAIGQR